MSTDQELKKGPFALKIFFLGVLACLCVALIGGTGYVKYRLDRAEITLSAPDNAFSPDQEIYQKTVGALGYSGFLGAAQSYMIQRDQRAMDDMRMALKTAQEALNRLSDKVSTPVRRDIKGIMDVYGGIVDRAASGGDALGTGLTNADILVATAALNTLDARLQTAMASERQTALAEARSWGIALTFLALFGLAATGLCAFAFLLSLRDSKKGPLLSLAQSVANLARGEMQNPVWGIERRDEVGDLARAVDQARLYFTQIPDVSFVEEDGAVRLKFEGEARSSFQSMMKKMSETFERTQQNALGFTGMLSAQQDLFNSLTARLNNALEEISGKGRASEETIRSLSRALMDATKSLALSQESGTAQLGRLVPYMQERVQNMAEVTQLAGQQVASSLQKLIQAETVVRNSASQSTHAVQQLSDATNQMGERMFAALNLMQASGKVLSETIEAVKARFNEAVGSLAKGENNLTQIIGRAESRLASTVNAEENMAALAARTASSAEKLEKAVNSISDRHEAINEQVVTAAHRMDSIIANFDSAQRAMNDAAGQIRRDGSLVANLLSELRANNDQLLSTIGQNSQSSFNAAQSLAEKSHALMQRLEVQIQQQATAADTHIGELAIHSQTMAQHASNTNAALVQAIASLKTEQEKLSASRSRFSETVADLGTKLEQHAVSTFGKTENWAAQSFTKISSIAEQMEGVMQRLNMLSQLTGTLGAVAGQLGQIVPSLVQYGSALPASLQAASLQAAPADTPVIEIDLEGTKALIVKQTEEIVHQLREQWHQAVAQIEAMHDQLAQIMGQQKDQLETRLIVMDKKIRETADALVTTDEEAEAEERQTGIMNEIISALSKINEHVLEIDGVIEDAGLKKEA